MAGSTSKKVLAVRFDRESILGIIDPQSFLQAGGIELLTPTGAVATLPYPDVKALCYLKELNAGSEWRPNRTFATRPKSEGLWVRFRFRDGDQMDGLLPNNLILLDGAGFTVAPPDPTFQNQRIFIPRTATSEIRVLGVVGTVVRQTRAKPVPGQFELFEK